jgi:hypothetical protein
MRSRRTAWPGSLSARSSQRRTSLREAGLIVDYALGGALAAIRYTEPFTTYDADIFFIPADVGLTAGIPAIYAHLHALGHRIEGEHMVIGGFPVQWLATTPLTEEAVREAEPIEFENVTGKIFRAEHLVAIAASVGRLKDRARIEQMLEQTELDRPLLDAILRRHALKLPH